MALLHLSSYSVTEYLKLSDWHKLITLKTILCSLSVLRWFNKNLTILGDPLKYPKINYTFQSESELESCGLSSGKSGSPWGSGSGSGAFLTTAL